jgi:predicted ATPase/DNA-binding SARP family transcriptional activator
MRIELLGDLCVSYEGGRIDRFPTQKTASLLALLAIHYPRTIGRDAAASAIWPGVGAVSARNSLNQAISTLRRQFPCCESQAGELFVSGRQTIGLNADWVVTDVAEFVSLMSQAKAVKSKSERTALLESAAEIYRGDIAPSLTDLWISPFRLQLRQANEFARRHLVKAYSKSGEPELAIPHVLQLLHRSPLSANFHSVLMELYLRAGQASAAEAHFKEAKQLFGRAGETIPEEMAALFAKASREARRAEGGLIARERRRQEPGARTNEEHTATNIPKTWDLFLGREDEIRQIESLFEVRKTVVGIVGIGGIGKTRLSIEMAHRSKSHFPGGMHFLSLSGLEFSESIASRLLQSMGDPGPVGDQPVAALARRFDTPAPTLLILDEIEHLSESSVSEMVEILEATPALQLLYTSRRPMGFPGEDRVYIEGLALAEKFSVWQEGAANSTAVALFVARAKLVCPEFVLSERNYASISHICSSLDGIPLAIELAASWSRMLGSEQIKEEILRNLDFLRRSSMSTAGRHQSLRAALTSSIQLLSDSQLRLLTRLATLAGPWALPLAKHLSPGEEITDDLRELTSYAIVVALRAEDTVTYRLPDVIRTIVREGLDDTVENGCLALQADYFLEILDGDSTDVDWVRTVAKNYPSMIALMNQLLSRGLHVPLHSMILSLAEYWRIRGPRNEGTQWFQWLLKSDISNAQRSRAQIHYARLVYCQGKYDLASQLCASGMDLLDKHADSHHYFLGSALRVFLSHEMGDIAQTTQFAELMYREAIEFGSPTDASMAMLVLGNQAVDAGNYELAFGRYKESLALADESGDVHQRLYVLDSLANLARLQGRIDAAVEWLKQTFSIRLEAGWIVAATASLSGLAICEITINRPEEAVQHLRRAIELTKDPYLVLPSLFYSAYFALVQLRRSHDAAKMYGYVCNLMDKHLVQLLDDPEMWEKHAALLEAQLSAGEIQSCKLIGYVFSQPQALEEMKRSVGLVPASDLC